MERSPAEKARALFAAAAFADDESLVALASELADSDRATVQATVMSLAALGGAATLKRSTSLADADTFVAGWFGDMAHRLEMAGAG